MAAPRKYPDELRERARGWQLRPGVIRPRPAGRSKKRTTTTNAAGEQIEISSPRINAKDELLRVRAFYLDIAQWAVDDPGRWAPWAVPCPISDAEISRAKELKHRKARMDQRTRERLPVLPVLARTSHERRLAAERRLRAAQGTQHGELILGTNGALRRAIAPTSIGRHVGAEDTAAGKRRNLTHEDEEAFWSFSTTEVLRLTGIRCEEMLELSHHSITGYRLPSTGESEAGEGPPLLRTIGRGRRGMGQLTPDVAVRSRPQGQTRVGQSRLVVNRVAP